MTDSIEIAITDGPSKFDLMLALFDRTYVNTRKVEFSFRGGQRVKASIRACEAEDASGQRWNIRGYVYKENTSVPDPRSFRAFYRTDKRAGSLVYEE